MADGKEEEGISEKNGEVPIKAFIYNKKEIDDAILKETGRDRREGEVRALVQRIQDSFNDILERRRKVEGVRVLYTHYGKFGDILGELFDLYELGFYNSTILLCVTLPQHLRQIILYHRLSIYMHYPITFMIK
jgi:hypothetical protein